jgi:glycerol-3-phosphate acyltransferase PlsY
VNLGQFLWVVGAYLAGTFPSSYLVIRLAGDASILREANRHDSLKDAHVLIKEHLGGKWGAVAATMDVVKGFAYVLVARHVGHLPNAWLATCGVLVVVGHTFPFYARALAGRGLAGAAGVTLALLPVGMAVAGVLIVLGYIVHLTGPASTVGFAAVPLVSWIRGQPPALVAMAGGILGVILVRRLEGVSEGAARCGWPRTLLYRLVWDRDPDRPPAPRRPATTGRTDRANIPPSE